MVVQELWETSSRCRVRLSEMPAMLVSTAIVHHFQPLMQSHMLQYIRREFFLLQFNDYLVWFFLLGTDNATLVVHMEGKNLNGGFYAHLILL